MKSLPSIAPRLHVTAIALTVGCLAVMPASLQAQRKKSNPASKVYISDVAGDAVIDTGDSIEDLTKKSAYAAQGTVIETRKSDDTADRGKNFSTMVYSNGTGAFFDADTRVEVKRFVQEPFTPNRVDIDVEPSVSQTQAFLARGTVGLCNSKQVAGSSMTYQTPHGSINIRGRKVVIEATRDVTKISMLEGESTVRAGEMDVGGHTVHAGEQAIIRSGGAGRPNIIQISPIPQMESPQLDEKVTMACQAKKTVYFEVKEKASDGANGEAAAEPLTAKEAEAQADAAVAGESAPPVANTGGVTAFDDPPPAAPSARELVPVQVVPTSLPTEYTLTPTRVESSTRPPGGD